MWRRFQPQPTIRSQRRTRTQLQLTEPHPSLSFNLRCKPGLRRSLDLRFSLALKRNLGLRLSPTPSLKEGVLSHKAVKAFYGRPCFKI